jgi:hypothetical protein
MRQNILILGAIIFISSNSIFGQNVIFKNMSEMEIEIINDLCSTFEDTIFVISPLVIDLIDSARLDIPTLKKAGFDESQFSLKSNDTLLIKSNKYFKALNTDSLIKYKNLKFTNEFIFQNGIDFLQQPILYYVEKEYGKEGICYFNKPILSKNNVYAIAEYWVSCGNLCGWGQIVLMKKMKGNWIIVETLVHRES